nr:uncharacterized protein LOC104845531 isoform X4 [Loxodonta africana]
MRWVLKRRHDLQPGAEDPATPRRQSFCKPSRCGASDAPSVCRPAGTPFPSTHRDVAWLLPWRSRGAAFAVGGLTMRTTLPTRRCVMSPHQSIANEGPGEGAFLCLRAGGDVTSGLALRFFLWMFECLSYSTGVFRSLSWRNIQTAVGLSGQDLGDESGFPCQKWRYWIRLRSRKTLADTRQDPYPQGPGSVSLRTKPWDGPGKREGAPLLELWRSLNLWWPRSLATGEDSTAASSRQREKVSVDHEIR